MERVTLFTDTLRYSFDDKGRVLEFTDIRTGVNYAKKDCLAFYLTEGEDRIAPSKVRIENGLISVVFPM